MLITACTILQSTALLNGTYFENAIILITENNTNGSTGFVTNNLFERSLNALQEFSHIKPFTLYNGGPVDSEHLFFIHRRPDVIEGGTQVCDGVFYGGNFTQAVTAINNNTLTEKDIKIFIGYCGWDAGELEAEIAEGSWKIIEEDVGSVWG